MPGSTQADTWYKVKLAIAFINYQLNQTEQLNPRPGSCASSTVSYTTAQTPPKTDQSERICLASCSTNMHDSAPNAATRLCEEEKPFPLCCVHPRFTRIKEKLCSFRLSQGYELKIYLLYEQYNRNLQSSTQTASQNVLCIKRCGSNLGCKRQRQVQEPPGFRAPAPAQAMAKHREGMKSSGEETTKQTTLEMPLVLRT